MINSIVANWESFRLTGEIHFLGSALQQGAELGQLVLEAEGELDTESTEDIKASIN